MQTGLAFMLIIGILTVGYIDIKNAEHQHQKEMLILQKDIQRDTMPKDSIIIIQGNKYKLEKYGK